MDSGNPTFKERFKKTAREALQLTLGLLLVILPAVGAGILLLLLFLQNTTVHVIIFGFTATICLGLLAGFMARWLLKKRSPALRFLAGAVALLIGLVVMYLVSSGMLGLSPYIRTAIDWYGLIQIAFGLGAVYIALYGFHRRRVAYDNVASADLPSPSAILVEPHASSPVPSVAIAVTTATVRPTTTRKTKASIKKGTKKNKLVVGKKAASKTVTSTRKSRRKVTLAGFDEHRCPYCLEEVKRNDPRGVVICPICKAYHHKDCWDITGRCQVPHDTPA